MAAQRLSGRNKKRDQRPNRPVPVTVANVEKRSIPVEIHVVGSVAPFSTVPITAQIGGQLQRVFFRQGDFVRQGQPLFAIDPRPQQAAVAQNQAQVERDQAAVAQNQANLYRDQNLVEQARGAVAANRAAVDQARANLKRDEAQQHFAQDEALRYRNLVRNGYVTMEQAQQYSTNSTAYESTIEADRAALRSAEANYQSAVAQMKGQQATLLADHAAVRSAQATVRSSQASVESVEVQLQYASINSPITGRTGTLNVHEGSIVRANDTTPLITIDQIQPIYVSFAVPEKYLPEIQARQQSGLTVTARLAEVEGPPEVGRVTFIENTVDNTTGTILLRATFPNPQRRLWPGQFVNVTLLLHNKANCLVLPSQAVQPGQQGDLVFVIKKDNTAEPRPVKVDFTYQDVSVLSQGVKEGETVVTDGQLLLTPGANVTIQKPKGEPSPKPTGTAR
ncbi:MAG: efflux RND transporter periplasmic adaptor subunit [Candidatus Eremiobacteraeota bacterium]|nr:efflux RND transporter periplasmic adaptor subunit [Candidatus Eremiobacteraeota bacterium]